MRQFLRRHGINFLFLAILLAAILHWIFQDKSSDGFWKMLAIIATIGSACIAFRHFLLSKTTDKINAIIYSPGAAKHIVQVLNFIAEKNDGSRTRLINKQTVETDEELFASVSFLLGFMDDVAIAITSGIVDESLVKDSMGNFIKRIYRGLRPYIEKVDEIENTSRYPNLTKLSLKWHGK